MCVSVSTDLGRSPTHVSSTLGVLFGVTNAARKSPVDPSVAGAASTSATRAKLNRAASDIVKDGLTKPVRIEQKIALT